MSTPLPRVCQTSYSMAQLFTDLSHVFISCFKKTDQTYQRISLNKLDDQGNPRSFDVADETGTQSLTQVLHYVENKHTGRIYLDESACVISQKCVAISIATPIYTLNVVLWNVYQFFRSIGIIAQRVFQEARRPFALGRYFEAVQILDREIRPLPGIVKERFLEIIRAPLFGMGMEVASLLGIIRPMHGRELVAMIEKAWHKGISYKQNMLRDIPERLEEESECRALWKLMHSDRELYFAECFQCRGNMLSDRHLRVISREGLRPYFG